MTSDHSPHSHDRDPALPFEDAARRAHRASLDRLSPRVRAQLAQRRRAALAGPRDTGIKAWPMLALGSTAALALAVGLFVLRGADDAATVAPPAVAIAPDTVPTTPPQVAPEQVAGQLSGQAPEVATNDTLAPVVENERVEVDALPDEWLAAEFAAGDQAVGLDSLEENPDFYLWLAANEGQADVTEAL
ncbi:hypothetical protein [Lysobacter hankyongensis]|uniref:Anti-sigma factor n=1 Tax=Lysobacter hankyongensis TaxID=1176535 RepID=A0ABP9BZ38_9GAMM